VSAKVLKQTVIVDPAEAAAAANALAEATEEARRRGHAEGVAEGGAVLAEAVAALTDQIAATRDAVARDAAATVQSDVETMVSMACDLASWFVEQAVDADPGRDSRTGMCRRWKPRSNGHGGLDVARETRIRTPLTRPLHRNRDDPVFRPQGRPHPNAVKRSRVGGSSRRRLA